MKSFAVIVAALALSIGPVAAFAPVAPVIHIQTSLSMKNENKIAASFVAAAFLAGSLLTAEPVLAADFGSSQIVAGRSGGRAGGRSYSPARSPSRPSTVYRSSSTTIVRPMAPTSTVILSPMGYSPFGYNPFGGFGLGYGLGAIGNSGNEMRDYRQETEIQRSQVELEAAKAREADLEARIRALESAPLQVVQ